MRDNEIRDKENGFFQEEWYNTKDTEALKISI